MPKLVLKVSQNVPDLPAAVRKEKGLAVKRVKTFNHSAATEDLVAWFVDPEFVAAHAKELGTAPILPGSVLLWNPQGASLFAESVPDSLVFDEVLSLKHPAPFLRTVRNLFRQMHLERELKRKDSLLKARETENSELLQVGIALSAERDNDKLLDYILRQLRHIARADAGTLYLLEKDKESGEQKLRFKITQNDSNPRDYSEFVMPLSKKTVSGYVASTGAILNIEDAYNIPADREYGFNTSFDTSTGYRSKSMLTVPMQDHKGEILGVVQLINCKPDEALRVTPEYADMVVIPFGKDVEPVVRSLASQAAVALENNLLYQEIETLFEGFVQASVKAIESRDPTTSGHSNRVALYTVGLAKAVDRVDAGTYADTRFSAENIKEIRYASLLHDFGKVGVREHVLVKAKKLYPAQMELVKMRFAYIRKSMMFHLLKERFTSLRDGGRDEYEKLKEGLDAKERGYLEEIDGYLASILIADEPAVLAEEPARILDEIHGKVFEEPDQTPIPYLNDDEYVKLSIRKGSLDESERKEIESHVTHTYQFLKTIPWTSEMKNIPTIAYGHHEKLSGRGYPRGINSPQIPV
ncbi:MAG TPA: HD domain-containing phosphohydrolase, partial [Spirochaetia bacterium]|nr:HD domain-containing phosphohydrolase [Spirochaetia bacterium]